MNLFKGFMKKIIATALLALPLLLTSCAPKLGGKDYSMNEVGTNSVTLRGSIIALEVVNLNAKQPNEPGIGAAVGAVTGAVTGNVVSNHGAFTTLAGGLLGGAAGHFAEQALTNQEGFNYTVQLDNGQIQNIVQGAEPRLSVGQRVLVVVNDRGSRGQGPRTRVVPDNTAH